MGQAAVGADLTMVTFQHTLGGNEEEAGGDARAVPRAPSVAWENQRPSWWLFPDHVRTSGRRVLRATEQLRCAFLGPGRTSEEAPWAEEGQGGKAGCPGRAAFRALRWPWVGRALSTRKTRDSFSRKDLPHPESANAPSLELLVLVATGLLTIPTFVELIPNM